MKNAIAILATLLIFANCNPQNPTPKEPDASAKAKSADQRSDTFILKNSAFYKNKDGNYHYQNVRYFPEDIGLSPYYLGPLLAEETKEVQGSSHSEEVKTTITLRLFDNDNKFRVVKTFRHVCDEVLLYPHFIEAATFFPSGGWTSIELFRYEDVLKPFLKSDEQYWYFNMNADNQHISKNCFFVMLTKFPKDKICELALSDMNGLLQQVNVKSAGKNEIEFTSPEITFTANNPYQYPYSPSQSQQCNTISIHPKDYTDLRKHVTGSAFRLLFYDSKENADSITIPIENGMFYNKPDKTFDISIFK